MQPAQASSTVEFRSGSSHEKPLAPPGADIPANAAPRAWDAATGGPPAPSRAPEDDPGAIEYDSWRVR